MMTDPVADMLTRIRNAVRIEAAFVEMPASRLKTGIAQALQREGFIWEFETLETPPQDTLRISLKYGPNGEQVIQNIDRISKPGRRVYVGRREMHEVRQGTGISVLSTSKGILSNREARREGVGGEVLCQLW